MTIDGNSWHCLLYQWWYKHKYRGSFTRYSNLCPYMRVVMFWAPIRAIFWNWIKLGPIPLNAITIPALLYGVPKLIGYYSYTIKSGLWEIYLIVAGGAIGGLVAVAILEYGFFPARKALATNAAKTSFLTLVKAYSRSAHDRICPEINWYE